MNKIKTIVTAAVLAIATFSFFSFSVTAQNKQQFEGVLVATIGASTTQIQSPIWYSFEESRSVASLLGIPVANGFTVGLTDGLRHYITAAGGGVITAQPQAGATTFKRQLPATSLVAPGEMDLVGWMGFPEQLDQISFITSMTPIKPKYLVIDLPNDCLHSHAFNTPPHQTTPCSEEEMQAVADRVVSVAFTAMDRGMIPIVTLLPPWEGVNTDISTAVFGFEWMISEGEYRHFAHILKATYEATPGLIVVDAWGNSTGSVPYAFRNALLSLFGTSPIYALGGTYTHAVDGMHPDRDTAYRAAARILYALSEYEG